MKKLSILFILLSCCLVSHAQIIDPVKWSSSVKQTGKKQFALHITAFVDQHWHLYSQDAGEEMISTSFTFMKNPIVKFDGAVEEVGDLVKENDPNLRLTMKYYYGKVDFVQKVELKTASSTVVKGSVTYIVCSDVDRKCLPAKTFSFSVRLDGK
jgi:hypothetical protein